MTITLNGEKKQMPDNITVLGLLEFLKIQRQRVAVELNMEIVKKDVYNTTPVKEGDSLEVVSFMAGGCCAIGTIENLRLEIGN
jgi:thiamine biosynthesis protein ThiS